VNDKLVHLKNALRIIAKYFPSETEVVIPPFAIAQQSLNKQRSAETTTLANCLQRSLGVMGSNPISWSEKRYLTS